MAPQAWRQQDYTLVTVPSSQCAEWNGTHNQNPIWSRLSQVTTNTVYHVSVCDKISTDQGLKADQKVINLQADIAIISRGGTISGLTFKGPHTVFFITPDASPNTPGPQCAGEQYVIKQNVFANNSASYIYTPCTINFNTQGQWRGQVYAGRVEFNGGVALAYAPRNIPGYDFGTGMIPEDDGDDLDLSGSPTLVGGNAAAPLEIRNIHSTQ